MLRSLIDRMVHVRRGSERTATHVARELARLGHDQHRARVRATARELCRCAGRDVPEALR